MSLLFLLLICNLFCQETIDSPKNIEIVNCIISNYDKYDATNFTKIENCGFKNYIIDSANSIINRNNDAYEKGFQIFYNYCPYNNFLFTLLKSDNTNSFYYLGHSNREYILRNVKEYHPSVGYYISDQKNLQLLIDSTSLNIELLNELGNTEPSFKINGHQHFYEISQKMLSLYFKIDVTSGPIMNSLEPSFDYAIESIEQFKTELEILKDGNELSKSDKEILDLYDLNNPNSDLLRYIFKVKRNLGLFVYEFSYSGSKIHVKRYIIPPLKIRSYSQDFQNPIYEKCR